MNTTIMFVCCLILILLGPPGVVGQQQEGGPAQFPAPLSLSAGSVLSLPVAAELTEEWRWEQLPLSGTILSLAIDPERPQVLYAGAGYGGLYKSSNSGADWITIGLTDSKVTCLAINPANPQMLFAGTNGGGVWKSSDGGTSWAASSTWWTNNVVHCLTLDPDNPQALFAGTDGGVWKSSDGGTSWAASSGGLTNSDVRSLALDPNNPQALYAGTNGGGVCRSSNGGASWTGSSNGLTNSHVNCLTINPNNSRVIYAGTDGGGVFKSSNGGTGWALYSSGLTNSKVWRLAISPNNSRVIYAGTDGGIFKSANDGESWVTSNYELTDIGVNCLAIDPINPLVLYVGTNSGVFKFTQPESPDGPGEPFFFDVPQGYWAHEEIGSLAEMGVVNGYPDGSFQPENPVTRAEFAKICLLTLGRNPKVPEGSRFPDMRKDHWAYLYVEEAAALGLMQGYPDGAFRPDGRVTLAEVITVAVRAKDWIQREPRTSWQVAEPDGSVRPMKVTDWFSMYVGAAEVNFLLRPGYDPHILATDLEGRPVFPANTPATRAQTSVLLLRIAGD